MSEKRFKLSKYVTPSSVSNFYDENGRMLNKEVVKVLNEQQATIQSLKEELELTANTKLYSRRKLEEENEQLQSENERLGKMNIELFDRVIPNLRRENEQLRQVVEEYRKTNKHLCELCADASKNGYLPPLEDLQ